MSAADDMRDRMEWENWVESQQRALQGDATTSGIDEWNHGKISRARIAGRPVPSFVQHPQGAYTGAWHIVRGWASPEFIEHIEQHGGARITWREWQDRARAGRETLAADEAAFRDDVQRPLDDLAYWRQLDDARGAMILDARAKGAAWADICRASGLSRQQANTLARNAAASAESARVSAAVAAYDDEPF